jgi:hypothetical protein
VSGQPYTGRLSRPAAKVLAAPPEHAEQLFWDVLDAAPRNPWGFPQWDEGGLESEDAHIASVGRLSRHPPREPSAQAPVRPSWTSSGRTTTSAAAPTPGSQPGGSVREFRVLAQILGTAWPRSQVRSAAASRAG